MQLLPQPSSKAISVVADRDDPTLPVILEFESPSTAITNAPMPASARKIVWMVSSMFAAAKLISVQPIRLLTVAGAER